MAITITIDAIEEGMVLEKAVQNKFAQVLLPIGTALNDKHIKMLKTWSIEFVEIESNNQLEKAEISDELIIEALETIAKRLSWQPENKFEEDIFQMGVINYAEKKMAKEK